MKKTALLAVALATCLAYVPAQAAEVVSSNIVGYQKVQLGAGFNMVSGQFLTVGENTVSITDVGKMDPSFSGFDEDFNFANTMKVWSNENDGYVTYGWAGTSPSALDPDYAEMDNTWLTFGAEPTDDTLNVAQGVWIITEKSGTITLAGEVPDRSQPKTVSLGAGFNMVAFPWPESAPVSTFCVLDSSFAGFDEDFNFANTMKVWSNAADGYVTYGWAGTSPSALDPDYAEMDNTWLTFGAEPTDAIIPAGSAVWIITEASGNAVFTPNSNE